MKTLETERLLIRPLTVDDAAFIIELLNDPSFIQNIGDRNVRTLEDAQNYIRTGSLASYAKNGFGLSLVILKTTGEAIGMCGLIKRDALEDVDIGYAYLPRYWSKGYAIEAALAMKSFAKVDVQLRRLVAIVDPVNTGSIRVLEKLGMKFEKMVRLSQDDIELKLYACEV
jgi:ribosomal-protein-alanine N-acetyltransferase